MRIAQVVCVFPPYKGGIGTVAYNYAKILKENGYQITTFTLSKDRINEDSNIGKMTYLYPWLRKGNAGLSIGLFWKLLKFDLIIFHYPFYGSDLIIFIIKLFYPKIRLIIHYHMDVFGLSYWEKLLSLPSVMIRNYLMQKTDIIISASFDYLNSSKIKSVFFNKRSKFVELPFGIDTNKFIPNRNRRSIDIKKIIFIGGLDKAHYFKGVDILIHAVSKLSFNNWELSIIGDGNLRKNYEEFAIKLNIKEKINFCGAVSIDKIISYLQSADLFILPSINQNEAFGIVLIEAMACGIPVIASNLPGVRSVFIDNKHGYSVKPGDAKDLKNKIENFFKSEKEQNNMSMNARKYAELKYNWQNYSRKVCKLIGDIK
jgi:glycosyltransferase involved in cell wall biosynthesis